MIFVVIILLIPTLLYLPPVQSAVCGFAEKWVADNTGMRVSVGGFSLKFPLKLSAHDVVLWEAEGDTILDAGSIETNVAFVPLLSKRVDIEYFRLKNTAVNYRSADSAMHARVRVGALTLDAGNVAMNNSVVRIKDVTLDNADVEFFYHILPDTAAVDTTSIDWAILVDNISLNNVACRVYMPQYFDTLQVTLPQAHLSGGDILLNENRVKLGVLSVQGGDYRYVAYGDVKRPPVESSPDSLQSDSEPMTVSIDSIILVDNRVAYITHRGQPAPLIDPAHIVADNINVGINNLYNRGGEVSLSIDDISFAERSGLRLTRAQGDVSLSEEGIFTLQDFSMGLPQSSLDANVVCDISILEKNSNASFDVVASARLACNDIVALYPDAVQYFVHNYGDNKSSYYKADVALNGTLNNITVERLDISQPDIFTLAAQGECSDVLDEVKRNVSLTCKAATTPQMVLYNYLPDTLMSNQITAMPITMRMQARLHGDSIAARIGMGCMGGAVSMRARYAMLQESYHVRANIKQLPLSPFLPQEDIGELTARLSLSGRHFSFDNEELQLSAQVHLDTLQYRNYSYENIDAEAQLGSNQWSLKADSEQRDVDVTVDAYGVYEKELLTANVDARVGMLDFKALNFSETPFDVSGDLVGEVVLSNVDSIVQAYATLDHLIIGLDDYRYYANPINLTAASDITYSYLDLNTGDASFNLSSDAGLTHMRPTMNRLAQLLDTIVQTQRLDMAELHYGLPPFELSVGMGSNNIIQRYINSQGVRFSSMALAISNDSLFNINGKVNKLELMGMTLDTISLNAYEKDNRLNYKLALDNRKGNVDDFAHAHIEGFLSGNSTRLYCIQNNRKEEVGFFFGCKVDFTPQQLSITFGPKEPIIGYKKWTLNKDNFVTYGYGNRKLSANVELEYANSHLYISTEEYDSRDINGMHIDMDNIELADWLLSTPFITPMSGLLSADVRVDMPNKGMSVSGGLGIDNFVYNSMPVGSFKANVDYEQGATNAKNLVATIEHNNREVLSGDIHMGVTSPNSINGKVSIDEFPLDIANALMLGNKGKLTGSIGSQIDLTGTLDAPVAQGHVKFDDVSIQLSQVGVDLSLDDTPIPISNSRIDFSNYGLTGANGKPLNINGYVDFSNLLDVGVDLSLKGKEFQPINMGSNRMAMVYGKAFADIDVKAAGSLNKLDVKGGVKVLPGTNVTYIMQENSLVSGPDYSDMISFVSFADTLANKQLKESRMYGSSTASVEIDIEDGVQLNVFLSPDGNNSIDLVGSGNLLYLSSALGESRMLGRYSLSKGYVRYTPPFMTQKIFDISEGSYVMWNGEVLNPYLNVNATLSQRSTVKSGDETRLVDFDIIVMLSNTFENLGISFDLKVLDDMNLQNELAALSREQREAKAMNIFLYNSYNDLTSATENSLVNTPLNTFLEYELNTWAQRTLKGVDLTFGIDNYGLDAAGAQRTDYSYQFSKSLFDNRLRVAVGGRYTSNQDVTENLRENLIDDLSLEYRVTKRDNMFVKAFRQRDYESIIEGEITQMGVGFLYRRQVGSLLDLFRRKKKEPEVTLTESQATPEQEEAKENTVSHELPQATDDNVLEAAREEEKE